MLNDDYEVVVQLKAFKRLVGCTYTLDKVNLRATIYAKGRKFEVSLINEAQLIPRLKVIYKAIV